MKIADARGLSEKELLTRKRELRQEFLNLKMQQSAGQIEKPSRLRDVRRAVAKVETALTEKRKNLQIKSREPQSKK